MTLHAPQKPSLVVIALPYNNQSSCLRCTTDSFRQINTRNMRHEPYAPNILKSVGGPLQHELARGVLVVPPSHADAEGVTGRHRGCV